MTVVEAFTDKLPTIEEVTNLYLYVQVSKPKDMLYPSTWAKYDKERTN